MRAFPQRRPQPRARLRLACFPFAGGSASQYRRWQNELGPEVEVCAFQPPGHETRIGEPLHDSVEALAAEAVEALAPLSELPQLLFGHSLGGFVALETHRRLEEAGEAPVRLVLAGSRAPHLPRRIDSPPHGLDDDGLRGRLRELGGTPEAVLDEPELFALVAPILRADFRAAHEYCPALRPIAAPIIALGGEDDEWVTPEDLRAWADYTTGRFEAHLFEGGHFFVQETEATVLAMVRAIVDGILQG